MKFKYCELVLVLLMMSCSSTLPADFIVDNFENQSVDSGLGTPLDYFSFGKQLADRGVSADFGATSGTKAAFYVINFDEDPGFGVGAAHENISLSITADHVLQVSLRIANGQTSGGFIAFRLADADGTVLRTPNSNLFSASSNFQVLAQAVSDVSFTDFNGSVTGLDLTHITSVGLLFFDQNYSGIAKLVFDDLKVVSVPEPSSIVMMMCVALFGLTTYRSRDAVQEGCL